MPRLPPGKSSPYSPSDRLGWFVKGYWKSVRTKFGRSTTRYWRQSWQVCFFCLFEMGLKTTHSKNSFIQSPINLYSPNRAVRCIRQVHTRSTDATVRRAACELWVYLLLLNTCTWAPPKSLLLMCHIVYEELKPFKSHISWCSAQQTVAFGLQVW